MTEVKLSSNELKKILKYIIANNQMLQREDKNPTAVAVEGIAGIGKTSSIIELSDELNMGFQKVNLSQLEELGDLVGYPIKEYKVSKVLEDGTIIEKWITESLLPTYIRSKYKYSGENKMSYAIPEWVQSLEENTILMFDDFTRADPRFMQAVMEIIDRQEYISWRLPKNCTIILTSNPDDGNYNVSSLDIAQQTRFVKINMKFDLDSWVEWALKNNIDERCINFMLANSEIVDEKLNSRALTTFFNTLASIKDYSSNLPLIQQLGEATIGIGPTGVFISFINKRLDKLISIKELFDYTKGVSEIEKVLKEQVGEGKDYRADIASIISRKATVYAVNSKDPVRKLCERLIFIGESEVFSEDLTFEMYRKLTSSNPTKFAPLARIEKYQQIMSI